VNNKIMTLLVTGIAVLASASVAAADFALPKLPGMSGSKSSGGGGNAVAMQDGVVQRYVQASTSVSTALRELALAYDLKDEAAKLDAEIASMQSGAVNDKDSLKKNSQVSSDAQAAVQKKMDAGTELTEEGRKHYIAALPHYVTGVRLTQQLPGDARNFSDAAQAQLASASLIEKTKLTSKLSTGTYLVGEIPGYSGRVLTGFKQIVTYAQKNKIPVPPDATAML
jgi:hypothetical protein